MSKRQKPQFEGKRVTVAGLGVSGFHTARWLAGQGAEVVVSEIRPLDELDGTVCRELEGLGVLLETGGHREETFVRADTVIVSPGVPLDMGPIVAARERGVPVLGELELASRLIHTPVIAITGTNGKSTVTALIGELLERGGRRVFVGGNLGTPLMAFAAAGTEADAAVVEVSSFQLDTIQTFSPAISVLLNISPDHLDRYSDYEAYVRAKLRVFENQGPESHVVLNDDDPRLREVRPGSGRAVYRYGLEERPGRDAFMTGGRAVVRLEGKETDYAVDAYGLPGRHNLENLLAGLLVGHILGIGADTVQQTINQFKGLPNRLVKVAEFKGVSFYNDSKATNVDAAARAVESLDRPLVLIAGGRHKGADYTDLVEAARGKVKGAVFLGEAADLLSRAFAGGVPCMRTADMGAAVRAAASLAEPGDAVLLAPACASFDMYADYAERGKAFVDAVERMINGQGQNKG
ncbi:MAG: UDP-N-acetylmuramoyl-L-alanine--D-glutamate ligase [Deltaproteobacteria bacterium]|nr:UDP-N-acetylmuramoyl-L-alanine--D-glutamate ligase [Deltaproteobacteria bacterium]